MSDEITLTYRGEALSNPVKLEKANRLLEIIPPYYPSEELVQSVELALLLRRPLLLMGEPGCGKTKLAQAVAYEIYGEDYQQYYFEWHVKSTSKARDGLYTFDHLKRLRDVELARATGKSGNNTADSEEDLETYVKTGPLGRAFDASRPGKPAVLLIDEIDKADIDFPNDLLLELDQKRFLIEETGREVRAAESPIIFITSNEEKELPPAFLRRCLFHYIEFPKSNTLRKIVSANFPQLDEELLDQILTRFDELRTAMKEDPNTEKKVSTSELLDWVKAINHFNQQSIRQQISGDKLLHYQTLLKTLNDMKLHQQKNNKHQ